MSTVTESDQSFCARAVAYLKTEISKQAPAIKLARLDAPVLRRLGNALQDSAAIDHAFAPVLLRRIHNAWVRYSG